MGEDNKKIHTITAEYILKQYPNNDVDQDPRAYIKGKFAYFFKKDWDYDWDKYSRAIGYKPPDKYRFLGYCLDKYAFKVACKGSECGFSHEIT